MLPLAEPHVLQLESYVQGKSIRQTEQEYGVTDVIKLASNENPFGPSPKAIEAAKKALREGHMYPNAHRYEVKEHICAHLNVVGIEPKNIVLGNGSNELISLLVRGLVGTKEALLNAWPSFVVYRLSARAFGRYEHAVPLTATYDYDLDTMVEVARGHHEHPVKLVFVANPNNPTGRPIAKAAIDQFLERMPEDIVIVFDEAYAEYVDSPDYQSAMPWVLKRSRTAVLRTFSKIYGMAGFRIGYAVACPLIADILHRVRDPFNVNGIAQLAALAALSDVEHVAKCRQNNLEQLPQIGRNLMALGFEVTPSAGNFILAHLNEAMPEVPALVDALMHQGVIIRSLPNYDLPRAVRITIGTPAQNERLLSAMAAVLKSY